MAKVSRHNENIHLQIGVGSKEYVALKSRNRLDFELYDYALELLHEQWAAINQKSSGTDSITEKKPNVSSAAE